MELDDQYEAIRTTKPVKPMEPIGASLKPILSAMWKTYMRQKNLEAEAGIDTKADIEKMRRWFRMALDGKATEEERIKLFGHDPMPQDNPLTCARCADKGWFFSRHAKVGKRGGTTPGIVVCDCPEGRKKNHAVFMHGKPKPEQRRRGGKRLE